MFFIQCGNELLLSKMQMFIIANKWKIEKESTRKISQLMHQQRTKIECYQGWADNPLVEEKLDPEYQECIQKKL